MPVTTILAIPYQQYAGEKLPNIGRVGYDSGPLDVSAQNLLLIQIKADLHETVEAYVNIYDANGTAFKMPVPSDGMLVIGAGSGTGRPSGVAFGEKVGVVVIAKDKSAESISASISIVGRT